MMTIKGDLVEMALNNEIDVLVHGCNCMCRMGKGIALTIKMVFPEAYEADLLTTPGDESKLGTCSYAEVLMNGKPLVIANAYTQVSWKGEGVLSLPWAIEAALKDVAKRYDGKRIGLPLIGCGLARGDWAVVGPIVDQALEGQDYRVVVLPEGLYPDGH